ncbi:MAG: sulfotransferase [Flavobacteriia bacterium]|nr:sulfotransferase [Flavobacteriia bacterium]
MSKGPYYIIGSERSGTNLLQNLLAKHSELAGPKSPHLFNTLYGHQRYYGNLQEKANKVELAKDFRTLFSHPFTNWKESHLLKIDDIASEGSDFIFTRLVHQFYSHFTREEGKSTYVSKELNADIAFHDILAVQPNAKFIHLVRNPYEQVASWMRTPLFHSHPEPVIKDWVKKQNEILELKNRYPEKVYTVKYEDIVSNTQLAISELLNFMDLVVEEQCFQTNQKKSGEEWNKLWENLSKPISNDLNKAAETLTNDEIGLITSHAKSILSELNYNRIEYPKPSGLKWKVKKYLRSRAFAKKAVTIEGYQETVMRVKFAKDIIERRKQNYLRS